MFCLEDNTERSESNPGRSLGIKIKVGGSCLEDSTLPVYAHRIFYMFWYCLPDSSFLLFFISRDFVPGYMNQGVTWLAGTTW